MNLTSIWSLNSMTSYVNRWTPEFVITAASDAFVALIGPSTHLAKLETIGTIA